MIYRRELSRDLAYGCAIGDALGVPFEFMSRGTFKCQGMIGYGTHHQPSGTWSDDTSMTLATLASLRDCGDIDVEDMRERFCDWLFDGAYAIDHNVFDFGNTTQRSLESGKGCSGMRDNGNGSLMRILPLALTDCSDDQIRNVSAITHAHKISTDCCVTMVNYARSIISGGNDIPDLDYSVITGSGYVLDTLKASIWCLNTTGSYRECVLKAVNLGDDTDTTACVAGGLAALKYGIESIPKEWIETLRGKKVIESCL